MSATLQMVGLRPVRSSDREFLLAVYASTREAELGLVDWSDEQKDAFVRHQFEAQTAHYLERYTGASFKVIEVDGEPAGRLYVARWEDEIRVMDIALLPEHRGTGIGTRLLRDLLDEAEASGKKVTVHVELNNPALSLYQRLGFRPVAERGVYLLLETRPS
jgi:ribosomal protein S18 acetylase RimI-like enzyme